MCVSYTLPTHSLHTPYTSSHHPYTLPTPSLHTSYTSLHTSYTSLHTPYTLPTPLGGKLSVDFWPSSTTKPCPLPHLIHPCTPPKHAPPTLPLHSRWESLGWLDLCLLHRHVRPLETRMRLLLGSDAKPYGHSLFGWRSQRLEAGRYRKTRSRLSIAYLLLSMPYL